MPMFILLLEATGQLGKDVIYVIVSFILPLKSQICISSLTENAEPPKDFSIAKSPCLFPKEPISNGWLISRAIAKTKEYINIEEREYKSNDEDLNHALAFIKIFSNHKLLLPVKMLALYALLNEESSSFQKLFNINNLKTTLEPIFKPYFQTVKTAAEDYARANGIELMQAKNRLIKLINDNKDKMISTDVFWHTNEKVFHKMICNPGTPQPVNRENCLLM